MDGMNGLNQNKITITIQIFIFVNINIHHDSVVTNTYDDDDELCLLD